MSSTEETETDRSLCVCVCVCLGVVKEPETAKFLIPITRNSIFHLNIREYRRLIKIHQKYRPNMI